MSEDTDNRFFNVEFAADAHPPSRVAALVEEGGAKKAKLDLLTLSTLGFAAGLYIAFGGMLFTLVLTNTQAEGFSGVSAWLGGIAFCVGLILVVVAGAELFTGNTLLTMAWMEGLVSTGEILRNWTIVYFANFVGAVTGAFVVWWMGTYDAGGGAVMAKSFAIAQPKVVARFDVNLMEGVMCNILVCLAIWMCLAARSVTDKILAAIVPISAFAALGFEHCVANMYLIPVAMMHGAPDVTVGGLIYNLIPVTIGNIIGGGVFVAGVYWLVYLRKK